MDRTLWRQLLPLYLLFVIAFPLAILWVESRPLDGPTICLFRQTTHFDCPGCGMTRAFRAMGRLDVVGAFRYNPLGPAFFLAALAFWGYAAIQVLTRGRFAVPQWWTRWRFRLLYWGFAIYLLVGIGRIIYEVRYPPPPPRPIAVWSGWPLPFVRK